MPSTVPEPGEFEALAPEYSDDALATVYVREHGDAIRFTAQWHCWHRWDGRRWAKDRTIEVFDLVRKTCRSVAWTSGLPDKHKRTLASAATIGAVERVARSDRSCAAVPDSWDRDPWLLNTPAGTVELKSGWLRPAKQSDLITRITAVGPGGECPTWVSFLERITAGDDELIAYLRRVAGYALTGSTREHALVFLYGTGANGKSTFLNAMLGVLGDYAQVAPMETFVEARGERHPTELAGLQGSRLVIVQEIEDGRRWNTTRIKALTAGDPIKARFMRGDFFEFVPACTLVIAGNHKPALRSVDEAIRRRMQLVPFVRTIPEPERDPTLPERLRAEWPGILDWAIQGCLEWQALGGLNPPAAVRVATADYLADEDVIQQWINERCEIDKRCELEQRSFDPTVVLHKDYQAWAKTRVEWILGIKSFSQALEDRGLQRDRSATHKGFRGVRLKTALELG